jgi:transposase InsO family protein
MHSVQQKAYESEIIITEVLRYRKDQKRIGTRKLLHEMQGFLAAHKFQIGRDVFFDLLATYGLLITRRKRRGGATTLSRHRFKKYPNLVKGFVPQAPNLLWVSDITYICLSDGFAYLSLITDAYSRKIVGYCLRQDLSAQGPLKALKMALEDNPGRQHLTHHSDRGIQYCCDEYVKCLTERDVKISMTEHGDPLENALAERVNGILKTELLEEKYADFKAAQKGIMVACSTYNNLRPHNSINNLKPSEAHQRSGPLPKKWKNYYLVNKQKKETHMAT